jgi:hypothetical protein
MQYEQRALVIFPLLHEPMLVSAGGQENAKQSLDLPAIEVIASFLA